MSENHTISKGTKRRKQMTALLAFVGVLGVLKEVKDTVEFTHTAIEYREIILAVLYYIGQSIFTFAIACIISAIVIYCMLGVVLNPAQTKAGDAAVRQHIETHFNIYMVPVSLVSGVIALVGVLPRRPDSYTTLFAVLCITLGATVVFSLCFLVYSLTSSDTENS